MSAPPLTLETQEKPVPLAPLARADLGWLVKQLSAQRVQGPRQTDLRQYEIRITRADGKHEWFYDRTPELVLAQARSQVEHGPTPNRRIA